MFVMPCFFLLSVMTLVDHFSICVCYLCVVETMFIFFISIQFHPFSFEGD
jgi:hypothetical protein